MNDFEFWAVGWTQAAEASSSSTNDSPAVDEVVSEAVAKEPARDEVRSVDLANGDGAKQSDVEKSPEATVEGVPSIFPISIFVIF